MEPKTAQLRVRPNVIIAEGSGRRGSCPFHCRQACSHDGAIFWATATRARSLLDAQAVDLLNAPAPGPAQTKPAAPAENKESPEKKYSAAAPAGPSTDSASSSALGKAASLFASVADRVLPGRKSNRRSKAAPS